MAPLGYNSKAEVSDNGDYPPLEPGDYRFKIDSAEEVTFKSGNQGLKLKLLVGYKNGRDVPCFCNLPYVDSMLWKLKHCLEAVGFEFENPPEAWELVGKMGLAEFKVKDDGYFDVVDFEPIAGPDVDKKKPNAKPAAKAAKADGSEDALPF